MRLKPTRQVSAEVILISMESWSVGFDGDDDVERHAGIRDDASAARPRLHLRAVSDYI
jgi:hypothetical protein